METNKSGEASSTMKSTLPSSLSSSATSVPVMSTTSGTPGRSFDSWSFFGGIFFAVTLIIIGFIIFSHYKVWNYNRF